MRHLLQEYIKEVLKDSIISELSKQPGTLSSLCKLLSDASGTAASPKRGAINWAGNIKDLEDAVRDIGLTLVSSKGKAKTVIGKPVAEYTGAKNAFLAFINMSDPIKLGNTSSRTVPVIVKPDSALTDPEACEKKLKGGTALGYGVEHAIYSALKPTSVENMIEAMSTSDERLNDLISAAEKIAPEALEKYFQSVATMRSQISQIEVNRKKIGNVAILGGPPGGGSSEYDIEAVGVNRGRPDARHKVVLHAKYMSDRLVGIPQAAEAGPENVKDQLAKELKPGAVALSSSSNSSVAYKIARDLLLFVGGRPPKKSLDGNVLAPDSLTPAGKAVRKQQTADGSPVQGEAEINVIMKDPQLRSKLLQNMESSGFYSSISGDIKRQLGVELKPRVGEESIKKMTSVFINFRKDLTPDIMVFKEDQGVNWNFEVTEGDTARKAFYVAAVSKDERIDNVMEIELGSIKRAKYVQVHKGENFYIWLEAL